MSLLDRIKKLVGRPDAAPISLEPPQPEVIPEGAGHPTDYDPAKDPTQIEVRKITYRDFVEPNGDDVIRRRIRDGYIVTYRKRDPGEERLAYVLVAGDEPKPERTEQEESFEQWRSRKLNGGLSDRSKADAVKVGPGAAQSSPSKGAYRSLTETGGVNGRGWNTGAMRWNGEIEP